MPDGLGMTGKMLIVAGLMIALVGAGLVWADRIPFLGRLPGDFRFEWKNGTFYAPMATCILISVILSVLFNLFSRR
ncbi:MAG: DUF2905 domain-containing protein [candidate division Zixibacteria bacterium]|nr:DUF2905 domain-containing protein [candidate division Zixibacteria bacterium]